MRWLWFVLLFWSVLGCTAEKYSLVRPVEYSGMCDASGAAALDSNLFVVACDEDNILRVYRNDQPGGPVKQFDFSAFLEVEGKFSEADLEGAARIGNRIYWIGSHGRNRDAKERSNRHRFFATDLQVVNGGVEMKPVGKPYRDLVEDLLAEPGLNRFRFADVAQRAPKEPGALDIEGLSATPEGHLLIGFRNPIPQGKALIIPLLNPDEVIQGRRARLGTPVQLDLGGLGIRDMTYHEGAYLIIAGTFDGGGESRLYRWAGGSSQPERLTVKHLKRYNPEAILVFPDKGLKEIQILSDDGNRPIGGVPGKEVLDPRRQKFRSFWVVD